MGAAAGLGLPSVEGWLRFPLAPYHAAGLWTGSLVQRQKLVGFQAWFLKVMMMMMMILFFFFFKEIATDLISRCLALGFSTQKLHLRRGKDTVSTTPGDRPLTQDGAACGHEPSGKVPGP